MRSYFRVSLCIPTLCIAAWGQAGWQTLNSNIYFNGGNVGIGTTTPTRKLRVDTSLQWDGFELNNGSNPVASIVGNNAGNDNGGLALLNGGVVGVSLQASGLSYFNNGNVGIGTTDPQAPLHVATNQSYSIIRYSNTATANWDAGLGATGNGALGGKFYWSYNTMPQMVLDSSGNLGIGTTNPQQKLSVNGTIGAREVVVTSSGWSDYVFRPGYRLPLLSEVAAYIAENGHLPGIPSEAEVTEKGIGVGEMEAKLLAKIEELTLQMIESESRLREAESKIEGLTRDNADLREHLAAHPGNPIGGDRSANRQ